MFARQFFNVFCIANRRFFILFNLLHTHYFTNSLFTLPSSPQRVFEGIGVWGKGNFCEKSSPSPIKISFIKLSQKQHVCVGGVRDEFLG